MSLSSYIAACGGFTNISRILAPDQRLIIEVFDADLVTPTVMIQSVDLVQERQQFTFARPEALSQHELLSAGEQLALQQHSLIERHQSPVECEYRPKWHISPPQGLLNDPNGFVYHQGQYHLFYQWYPYTCEHKDKYWAHLVSDDLIDWHWRPVALTPSHAFDSHGVFSGHAVSQGNELMLFYTGNTRIGPQRDRHTTQCVAVSSDGIEFHKRGPVVSQLPEGVTAHIRDPKVVHIDNQWLMLLGAQTEQLQGRIAVYRSNDLSDWHFEGLFGQELGEFGYMWECPDLFELGGETFAVVCPQGVASFSAKNTIPHHNGIAKATWSTEQGLLLREFAHLDHGFDFYAPQTLLTPQGKRVMCAWMGVPDEIDQPSADNGWVHQLTCMRELSYRDGQLIQWPLAQLDNLVGETEYVTLSGQTYDPQTKSFDLQLSLTEGSELQLFADERYHLSLRFDNQVLILDRSATLNRAQDTQRELPVEGDKVELRILADTSSAEIFVNQGAAVLSTRVFTPELARAIRLKGQSQSAVLKTLKAAQAPFVN
ncbi:glycoside hydrolase family 32 protein [Vibrio sp. WXL103]|uniref:glycoside hydrolase family 32 protein n=1 Tax=Vibrio sp. WXL103 TaxID=3450710 RepID=UPI003EC7E09E